MDAQCFVLSFWEVSTFEYEQVTMEIPLYCVGTTHGKRALQFYTNTYNFKTKSHTDFQYVPNKSSKIALYDNSNSIKPGYQHKMMNNSKRILRK